jgi:GT2 family glycosyltransferase
MEYGQRGQGNLLRLHQVPRSLQCDIPVQRSAGHGQITTKLPVESAAAVILIVNWDGRQYLERCLTALFTSIGDQADVIVIDNGSTDGSCEWVAVHFPQVQIIALSDNTGFAVANNIGIRTTTAPYLVLLNNDTEVQAGWLEALLNVVESDPTIGMCAPCVMLADRDNTIDSAGIRVDVLGFAWQVGHKERDGAAFRTQRDVFGPSGAAALYRRAMLEQIGQLDEDFGSYYEDVDLAWRAQRAGWRCRYVPQSKVLHVHSATSRRQPERKLYLTTRNRWWTLVKNYPLPQLWLMLPLIVMADGASLICAWMRCRSLTPLKARRDALIGLYRMWGKRRQR